MSELFYRPENAWVGDVIPYFENGFKLFYLKNWRDNYDHTRQKGWHLLETDDFVTVEESGACGIEGGTGSILEVDGTYHLFYCEFPAADRQVVSHAVSDDLVEWTLRPDDSFTADGERYERAEWRDPHVFWNDAASEYWMLISTRLASGVTNRRGCVGLCASDDLVEWEIREPLYAPGRHVGAHECADIFRWGDWWYLVFSNYTDRFRTFYRMSNSPAGPWHAPPNDTFDGRAFYAGKTCAGGAGRQVHTGERRRYIFGWNPTKTENLFDWNPPGHDGRDYDTWDWGGHLVVHELVQHDDGTLGVRPPGTLAETFSSQTDVEFETTVGEWHTEENVLVGHAPHSMAVTYGKSPAEPYRLRGGVRFEAGTRGVGLHLRVQDDLSQGYQFALEPDRDRVRYQSHLVQTEEGGKTLPYDVELERPIELSPDLQYDFTVIVDDSICELYLDDEVALSTRVYDLTAGRLGLYVRDGTARFSKLEYSTPTSPQGVV